MPKFAIFDRGAGFCQWIGNGETARDVLLQFDKAVGINPDNEPMDEVAEDFTAYEISDADEAALTEWDDGRTGLAFPLSPHAEVAA